MLDDAVLTVFPIDKSYYLWLTYTTAKGDKWYIVSDKLRTQYFLFHNKKMTARKSENAADLYKYIKEQV